MSQRFRCVSVNNPHDAAPSPWREIEEEFLAQPDVKQRNDLFLARLKELNVDPFSVLRDILEIVPNAPCPSDHNVAVVQADLPPLRTLADLAPMLRAVEWIRSGWLAHGNLVLLVATPGLGKTYLLEHLAGCICTGRPWLGGMLAIEPGPTLWLEAEAGEAILLERAEALDIPLQTLVLPSIGAADEITTPDLRDPEHKSAIERDIRRPEVRMMCVDSLSGAIGGDENAKKDMMPAMQWLAQLARNSGKPIIAIHHLTKLRGAEITLESVRGHGCIAQMPRIVWALEKPDPDDDALRLRVIKNNLARMPEPIGVRITERGPVTCDLPRAPQKETQLDRASEFLRAILQTAPQRQFHVETQAQANGIASKTLRRAKERLRVVSLKQQLEDGTFGWVWALPAKETIGERE
jgi:hypothetical protein